MVSAAHRREYYEKNRERLLARSKEWRKRNRSHNLAVMRAADLRREYGITKEDYDRLLMQQQGKCAICHSLQNQKSLAVDHDHKTNRVRGLLCFRCNIVLGHTNDDPALLQQMIDYLAA